MAYRKPRTNLYTKESAAWPAILSQGFHGPLWMGANFTAYTQEGYCQNPTVYACINTTIRNLRGIEWGVFYREGSEVVWIDEGPLCDLLRKPNGRESFGSIVGQWVGSMEITGNAYIEGVSLDKGKQFITRPPQELFVLRPDRMFITPGTPLIPIEAYQYRAGGVNIDYVVQLWKDPDSGVTHPRLPVMHSRYWNPQDDFYGLSPMAAAAHNVDSTNSAQNWNVSLMQNMARPGGAFVSKDPMTAQQVEDYTNIIRQKFGGASNAGRPLVLGNDFTWTDLSISPKELDWLKSIQEDDNAICKVFGIPPEILGNSATRTYANYETAEKAVWNDKWMPTADMLVDDLNLWLAPLFWEIYGQEVYIGYRKDRIEAIQQDRQVVQANATSLFAGTLITLNEGRRMIGQEPDPNGDVYMVPSMAVLTPRAQLGKMSNAQSQQVINPPAPPTPAAGAPKPKPKKPVKKELLITSNPSLDAMFHKTINGLKLLTK